MPGFADPCMPLRVHSPRMHGVHWAVRLLCRLPLGWACMCAVPRRRLLLARGFFTDPLPSGAVQCTNRGRLCSGLPRVVDLPIGEVHSGSPERDE